MIAGYFDPDGRPYVGARVALPRLGIADWVPFLLDTGSDATILHSTDGQRLRCPFDELANPEDFTSAGGPVRYYAEPAIITFDDDGATRNFPVDLYIAKPHPEIDDLESLLGRDILNGIRMEYDYPQRRLRLAGQ